MKARKRIKHKWCISGSKKENRKGTGNKSEES
jgi:hypothetical protein